MLDVRTSPRILVETAREFAGRGWQLGTCGNLSIKLSDEPLLYHCTSSGKDKSRLTEDDILVAGADGQAVEGRGAASSEAVIHSSIYRRTDAGAVYHVHTVWNNLASLLCRERGHVPIQGVEMIKGLEGRAMGDLVRLPLVPNDADMRVVARHVEQALDLGVPGVLVHLHGIYSWGRTPEDAKRHVEIFEFLMELWCRAQAVAPGSLFP